MSLNLHRRITNGDLIALIAELNRVTGIKPDQTGRYLQDGEFVLASAYGGWQLQRLRGKGIESVTSGYQTKGQLYKEIQAILKGIRMMPWPSL